MDDRRDNPPNRSRSSAHAPPPQGGAAAEAELSAESFHPAGGSQSQAPTSQTLIDLDQSQPTVKSPSPPSPPRGADSPTSPPMDEPAIELRYQRLRFHALGGLGCIFRASDEKLHRDVALKFIRPEAAGNPIHTERFCIEAEITARLDHPGVVPVYGIGRTDDGQPFYAMRFIQGETLDEAIRRFHSGEPGNRFNRKALEFRTLLNRFVALCQTIGYAHNRGIVHRDIKPANVMLGRFGETIVLDWGLALPVGRDERARASGEQTLMPSTGGDSGGASSGSGAGTPAYMSPEQARGELQVGPASDVYSLGTTLYKLLTGRPPFRGSSLNEIMEDVRSGTFIAPREVDSRVPAALEAICVKAMAFDPRDRYASAIDLARDVERYLADEPPHAYREPTSEKIVRWARRHRLATLVAAAAMLAIVLVAGSAAWSLGRLANRERDARVVADEAREESLELAAKFAARTIAAEIDRRWWILEAEANDAELRSLLEAAADRESAPAAHQKLQEWIQDRFHKHADSGRAASWFIQDARGLQLARWPLGESVGKNFAFRDYFHGQGRDLAEDATEPIVPIREPSRSIVTRSTVTGNLMVAFSVPVWKGQPRVSEVLGVLAMTVELHRFGVLDGLGRERLAVLIDTGRDWIEEEERRGLVLHHRAFADAPRGDAAAPRVLRMPPAQIDEMRSATAGGSAGRLLRGYRDPADAPGDPPWLAAWEPVVLRGRPEHLRDTGWVVIVQERLAGGESE